MRKKNIRRIVVPQFTVANGSSAAVSKEIGNLNGTIRQFTVAVNDNTGNRTATVAFLDASDYVMHSEAAIAENATTAFKYMTESATDIPLAVLVDDTITVKMTPSDDPGASGMTVDVVFYVDEG